MITLPIGLVVALALGAALLVAGFILECRMLRRELERKQLDRDLAPSEERLPASIAAACGTSDLEEAARRVRDWRREAEGGERGRQSETSRRRGA